MEHRPPKEQANGRPPMMDVVDEKGGSQAQGGADQARVHDESDELYGAPAGAAGGPTRDDGPPRGRTASSNAPEEEAAVDARKIVRKHLAAKMGSKAWTLPTPTPDVDAHGFEDPISDKFWKNVWVACAAHNVSSCLVQSFFGSLS